MSKQALIDALNEDLANEYTAILQYTTYSAMVRGPWRTELRTFFQTEIPDEQLHAQYLADKVAALGGVPTTTPKPVPVCQSAEEMLQAVAATEAGTIKRYTEHLKLAEAMGEIGLKVQLENFISDEQGHLQEVEQILAEWR